MKKRIFWSICLTSLASVLLVAACVLGLVYSKVDTQAWGTLRTEGYYAAEGYAVGGQEYLASIGGNENRVTLVAQDGTVLYDSYEAAAGLDNHANRPEVADALQSGSGQAVRVSDTVGKRTFYYALRVDGGVLRVSLTTDTLWNTTLGYIPLLLLACLGVVIVAMLLARYITRRIIDPINGINLKDPLGSEAYGELSPLLRRIAKQNGQIQTQIEKLHERQLEFDTITENMDEGLVVLDRDCLVLSINNSARNILAVPDEGWKGQHILELNRNLTLDKAIKASLGGQREEYILPLEGRKFRILASPAMVYGRVNGVVLLLVDETERLEAESLRREFTANVSHELKTPLTSISGYAEIMQNGLVKPEDIGTFAGRIRDEADRLIALVVDIIKLSKLDEKETVFDPEPVDLFNLATQTASELKSKVDKKDVALEVAGAHVEVEGIRSILGEVLFNLCDNAVKYNRDGGEVRVTVWREEETAYIKVSDTGIGIPPDQQPRVFERFYRGDTSHSASEVGGTGLGLSIVKRGALFHGGQVSLESMPGKGSSFLVSLPVSFTE